MTTGLARYQKCGNFHFLTFSCYRRQPLLASPSACQVFEEELEWARRHYCLAIAGYVVMPEHVHLLLSEPRKSSLSTVLQMLKLRVSRRLKRSEAPAFWQHRYYDFNVWSEEKSREKLRYIHRNPVRRGLAAKPEDWPWSSFRHYATGLRGTVEIESPWTAAARGHRLPEAFALTLPI